MRFWLRLSPGIRPCIGSLRSVSEAGRRCYITLAVTLSNSKKRERIWRPRKCWHNVSSQQGYDVEFTQSIPPAVFRCNDDDVALDLATSPLRSKYIYFTGIVYPRVLAERDKRALKPRGSSDFGIAIAISDFGHGSPNHVTARERQRHWSPQIIAQSHWYLADSYPLNKHAVNSTPVGFARREEEGFGSCRSGQHFQKDPRSTIRS